MVPSVTTQETETIECTQPPITLSRKRLEGKRAAMVTFSPYPFDPRPRRAIDALNSEGMTVDRICLGSEKAPKREFLQGIEVFRIPLINLRSIKKNAAANSSTATDMRRLF